MALAVAPLISTYQLHITYRWDPHEPPEPRVLTVVTDASEAGDFARAEVEADPEVVAVRVFEEGVDDPGGEPLTAWYRARCGHIVHVDPWWAGCARCAAEQRQVLDEARRVDREREEKGQEPLQRAGLRIVGVGAGRRVV